MRNTVNHEVNITQRNYYDNVVTINRNDPKIELMKINDFVTGNKSSICNVYGISPSELNKYFSIIGEKSFNQAQ